MKTGKGDDLIGTGKNIDLTIRLLLIVILLAWCVMIILPFVVPVLWGAILAITLYPLYSKLLKLMKGKRGLASSAATLLMLVLLVVPSVWLISALVEGTGLFVNSLRDNTLHIPPPKQSVADWPVIGEPLYKGWLMLTTNLEGAIVKYSEQILKIGDKFFGAISNVVSSLLMMLLSIIISGIFLVSSDKSEKSFSLLASRIGGKKADEIISLIVQTIRNVAKGILGVAFLQFVLLGAAFILAGIPFAGVWAVLVLLLGVVQLPAGIVGIPVIIYLYSVREPLPATLWSVLILVLSLSDNVLKPWLMGMGAPVPMLVIFLGAIGGMIMSGFIGLFTGAIVLSLGYKLVTAWLKNNENEEQAESFARGEK